MLVDPVISWLKVVAGYTPANPFASVRNGTSLFEMMEVMMGTVVEHHPVEALRDLPRFVATLDPSSREKLTTLLSGYRDSTDKFLRYLATWSDEVGRASASAMTAFQEVTIPWSNAAADLRKAFDHTGRGLWSAVAPPLARLTATDGIAHEADDVLRVCVTGASADSEIAGGVCEAGSRCQTDSMFNAWPVYRPPDRRIASRRRLLVAPITIICTIT